MVLRVGVLGGVVLAGAVRERELSDDVPQRAQRLGAVVVAVVLDAEVAHHHLGEITTGAGDEHRERRLVFVGDPSGQRPRTLQVGVDG
nr:hypothetical protein [Pseudonocardia sp. Ae717_Ps2]